MTVPTLITDRLVLRPLVVADAPAISALSGDPRISEMTASIVHTHDVLRVDEWIRHAYREIPRLRLPLAVVRRSDRTLIGVVNLASDDRAIGNIDYWMGVPYWGRGYATEAATALVDYAFETMRLAEIQAIHMTRNDASARVLSKLGMQKLGSSIDVVHGDLQPVERYRLRRDDFIRREKRDPSM